MATAAGRWAAGLEAWRIPDHIIQAAPSSPWICPVDRFTVDDGAIPDSPSHRLARQALEDGPYGDRSVLDLGCGGGRAGLALVPPATRVTGVDSSPGMLAAFAEAAGRRGVAHAGLLGSWPQIADRAPDAEVVVAHHVAYNVTDLGAFALAATAHARRRVVLELPERHPLSHLAGLWKHFWGLDRPGGPTADDARAVLIEAGLPVRARAWTDEAAEHSRRTRLSPRRQVELARIRLCLPAERDGEIAEAMAALGPPEPRRMVTLWWDAKPRQPSIDTSAPVAIRSTPSGSERTSSTVKP